LLREYLDSVADIEILAECANGFEAVKAISEQQAGYCFSGCSDAQTDGF